MCSAVLTCRYLVKAFVLLSKVDTTRTAGAYNVFEVVYIESLVSRLYDEFVSRITVDIMSKPWPSSMHDACENWLVAFGSYTHGSEPPLGPANDTDFHALEADLKSAAVYYPANQPFSRVMQYMSKRLPCYMDRTRLTDVHRMLTEFGIDESFYYSPLRYSESFGGPPMCGVFTCTDVTVLEKSFKLSVYHMIGPEMTHTMTADFMALTKQAHDHERLNGPFISSGDNEEVLVHFLALRHALMFYLAFVAARDHGFTKIADVNVGGGGVLLYGHMMMDRFQTDVHNAAFYHLGYGTEEFEKEFPGIRLVDAPKVVPDSLKEDMDDILHINAWGHSSFIGNGNVKTSTLDGAWGCIGRFAPLGWPYSNPFLRWRAVNTDDLEKSFPSGRPKGRLFGKPHAELFAGRKKVEEDGAGSSSAPPQEESRKRTRAVSKKAQA